MRLLQAAGSAEQSRARARPPRTSPHACLRFSYHSLLPTPLACQWARTCRSTVCICAICFAPVPAALSVQRLFPGDCLVCEVLPKEEPRGGSAFSLRFHVLRWGWRAGVGFAAGVCVGACAWGEVGARRGVGVGYCWAAAAWANGTGANRCPPLLRTPQCDSGCHAARPAAASCPQPTPEPSTNQPLTAPAAPEPALVSARPAVPTTTVARK